MAVTKIEWTASQNPDGTWSQGYSFNPWVGCEKVSPACDHCYAEAWAKRAGDAELWNGQRRRTTPANWRTPLKWHRQAVAAGVRSRVFGPSLADPWDNKVPVEWRADYFATIRATPQLDWLLLTKRPSNMRKMAPPDWGAGWPNVWLGTTVENPAEAKRRIGHLQAMPAVVRFLSCEPLLEAIEPDLSGIDWVICGGESGPGARLMDLGWARALRDQCAAAGVAFFMKQMTGKAPIPSDLMVRQFPTPRAAQALAAE